MRGKRQEIVSKNIYIKIILINLNAIAEIELRTIEVSLLVFVKNVKTFNIVNLLINFIYMIPNNFISEIMTNNTTIILI